MQIFLASKKIFKGFCAFFLGLAGLVGASLILLIFRLHQGPLALDGLTPYLEKNLKNFTPSFHIHVTHPQLIWSEMSDPFKIRFDKVTIQHQKYTAHKIETGELQLSFDLKDLLIGRFQPSGIEIQAPHLYLENLDAFSIQPQIQSHSQEDFILELFQNVMQQEDSSASIPLKSLKIKQGSIALNDPQGWGVWQLPQIDVEVAKKTHKFILRVKTQINQQTYEGSLEQSAKEQQTKFFIDLPAVSLSLLQHFQPKFRQKLPLSLQESLKVLDDNPLNFSLKTQGLYEHSQGFKEGTLSIEVLPGSLNLPTLFPQAVPLQKAIFQAHIKDNAWSLTQGLISLDHCLITLLGSGKWQQDVAGTSFDFKSKVANVSPETLSHLWPLFAVPTPRKWVLENITDFKVSEANCDFSGQLSYSNAQPDTRLASISGAIHFEKAKLRYLDTMPVIENITGTAHFNKETFIIDILQGQSAGIALQSARVIIHDLPLKDQTLELRAILQGSLENVLKYSDMPPLFIARRHDLNSLGCTGKANIQLDLQFPLEIDIDPALIQVKMGADLTDVALKKSLGFGDILVSKGNFKLAVKEGQVGISGACLLNDLGARIQWQNLSSPLSAPQTKWRIDTSLTPLVLSKFGVEVTSLLQGTVPTVLTYVEDGSTQLGELDISCDLKPLSINTPFVLKPLHQAGSLKALVLLQNQKLREIKKFQLTSLPSFQVDAQALFQGDGKTFKEVTLHQVNWGISKFKGKLTKPLHGPYTIRLEGKVLDAYHLNQQREKQTISEFPIINDGVQLFAHFKEVQIDPHFRLFDNTLTFNYKKDSFSDLRFKAYLKDSKRPKELVYGVIESQSPTKRRFTLQTESAGLLVRSLGIPVKMYGGKFQLYAFNDRLDKHPLSWYGKMRILNFTVREVPVLGQILSLAFPTGMADLLSEKGLPFGRFSTNFILTPQKIMLDKGLARGNSLGITLHGYLGRSSKEIHLGGSVIPAYVLNSLIAKIPLIGEILTGGKNEGLFSASYSIEGSQDKPKISINPASFLTPGFLRGIFEGFGSGNEEDEDE